MTTIREVAMRIRHALFGKPPTVPCLPELPPLPDVQLDGPLAELEALSERTGKARAHAHRLTRRAHVELLSLPIEDIGRALGDKR